MKIAFIGTGNMGTGFAKSLAKTSNEVFMGSREPEKARNMAESFGKNLKGGSVKDAAEFGDIIILAVAWDNMKDVLKELGDLSGKIVVDISNPVKWADMSGLAVPENTSAAEEIAKIIPKAKVVKAFNTVFSDILQSSPKFGNESVSVFYCGDHEDAKKKVHQLIKDLGYDPVDAGPLASARLLEQLGFINILMAFKLKMGANQAFKLLRR